MLSFYLSILQLHVLFLPIVHHRSEVEATKKRKSIVYLLHQVNTSNHNLKKPKNDFFFQHFVTFIFGILVPIPQNYIHFTTLEYAFKSYVPLKGCLKASTKIKLIIRLYGALEKSPFQKALDYHHTGNSFHKGNYQQLHQKLYHFHSSSCSSGNFAPNVDLKALSVTFANQTMNSKHALDQNKVIKLIS